jgi:hypothetical protein
MRASSVMPRTVRGSPPDALINASSERDKAKCTSALRSQDKRTSPIFSSDAARQPAPLRGDPLRSLPQRQYLAANGATWLNQPLARCRCRRKPDNQHRRAVHRRGRSHLRGFGTPWYTAIISSVSMRRMRDGVLDGAARDRCPHMKWKYATKAECR